MFNSFKRPARPDDLSNICRSGTIDGLTRSPQMLRDIGFDCGPRIETRDQSGLWLLYPRG